MYEKRWVIQILVVDRKILCNPTFYSICNSKLISIEKTIIITCPTKGIENLYKDGSENSLLQKRERLVL